MELELVRQSAQSVTADAVVVFEAEEGKTFADAFNNQYESGEVSGKYAEYTLVHNPAGFAASRVLISGLGKTEALDAAKLRKLAAGALRALKGKGVRKAAVALSGSLASETNAAAITEAAAVALWEPDQLKSKKE